MNAQSIEKLRKRFILLATLAFIIVMAAISGLIFTTNLLVTRREVREVLDYIIQNEGDLPEPSSEVQNRPAGDEGPAPEADSEQGQEPSGREQAENSGNTAGIPGRALSFKDRMELSLADMFGYRSQLYQSPEFFYATRYFAVLFDPDGRVTSVKTSHITSVNSKQAEEYARIALHQFFRFGSFGTFYYKVGDLKDGGVIVVYLDSAYQVATNGRLLFTALALIGLGMLIAFVLVRLLSYRVVGPEISAAERQKHFITNASHELKTPLAVIRANTEVEQMISGENEWNTSTMRQVDRLTGLIANLVMIAKAEEKEAGENEIERLQIDVSKVLEETADTFLPVAAADEKTLKKEIPPGISFKASESELRQLASLLIDNAIKYCDEGGVIAVRLERRGKNLRLYFTNSFAKGANVDYTRFFDRFYRQDEAHSVDKGGYGIGLSIAEGLVQLYHGSIDVSWKDGSITFLCILRSAR